MFQTPQDARSIFSKFQFLFTKLTGIRMATLVLLAIAAVGSRTLTHIFTMAAPWMSEALSSYYRVFSSARWFPFALGKTLCRLVFEIDPDASKPIILAVDDTSTSHSGPKVYGKGKHRDAVRSTNKFTNWLFGLKWVVVSVVIQPTFCTRPWALPVLIALYRTRAVNAEEGRTHKTCSEWAIRLTRLLLHWFPDRKFILLGDGDYSNHDMVRFAVKHKKQLTFVGKFPANAALYAKPEYKGNGRRPQKGKRIASPQETVAQRRRFRHATVSWYGGKSRKIGYAVGEGLWYKSSCGAKPIRWVYVCDEQGTHRDEYLFSTDEKMQATKTVELYVMRWSIETTFQECRSELGLGTTRKRSKKAVLRTEPWLMCLYSVTTLIYIEHLKRCEAKVKQYPWYEKTEPTFSTARCTVARLVWDESIFATPLISPCVQKLTPETRDFLLDQLTQAT